MPNNVLTAPMALLKVNGLPLGFCRGIRVNENFQRGEVREIGSLFTKEIPVLSWSGSVSLTFYNVDFSISQLPDAIKREVQTIQEFSQYLLFQCSGVTLDLYRSYKDCQIVDGVIQEKAYAQIRGLYLESEGFDIQEASISNREQSFRYLYPIIFPK